MTSFNKVTSFWCDTVSESNSFFSLVTCSRALRRSSINFCVLGASSAISFCNCLNAAFRTSLSSSNTATRSFNSSISSLRDSTISDIAELFCCRIKRTLSSSWTLSRSVCSALSRVVLASSWAALSS